MTGPFRGISGIQVLTNEPLARHTSLRVGGRAQFLVRVRSKRALGNVLHIITERSMKHAVIGAGTNILCSDSGFAGAVLQLAGIFNRIVQEGDVFVCGAGSRIDRFLEVTSDAGFGGGEFLAGIPGTIGGGIMGNAGAFGRSFADITQQVTVFDRRGVERGLDASAIGFGYRSSDLGKYSVIASARIRLHRARRASIKRMIDEHIAYRWKRQPGGYSAGSFFKNPVPHAAGRLIEECGLKGLRVGDAEVSMKHANFIINRGHASASDILRLARKIQRTVKREKGIHLQMEVKVLK